MQSKYALRRAAAYLQGRIEFADLMAEPTFRDFVCLYMAEGYKRCRNTVTVCNALTEVEQRAPERTDLEVEVWGSERNRQ
jgi:hypothetical protein